MYVATEVPFLWMIVQCVGDHRITQESKRFKETSPFFSKEKS